MATILSVDAAHGDGKFPPLTSEQGDHITALLRPVIGQATWHDGPHQARWGGGESIITGAARTARLSARVAAAEAYREGSLILKCHR